MIKGDKILPGFSLIAFDSSNSSRLPKSVPISMMRSLRALLLYALAGQTSRPDFRRPAPLPPTAIMIQCISLGGRGIWRIIRDDRRHVRMYIKTTESVMATYSMRSGTNEGEVGLVPIKR